MLAVMVLVSSAPARAASFEAFCHRLFITLADLADVTSRGITGYPLKDAAVAYVVRTVQSRIPPAEGNFTNRVVSVEVAGQPVRFRVREILGRGGYGVVHWIEWVSLPESLRESHPRLFDDEGRPRTDLVVKFANQLPGSARERARERLIEEYGETHEITQAVLRLGRDPITGADTLLHGTFGGEPFLIKALVQAQDVRALGKAQTGLREVQTARLRELYRSADLLYRRFHIALDLRAENLFWDEGAGDWGMYELSRVTHNNPAFTTQGFPGYVTYFEAAMARYRRE